MLSIKPSNNCQIVEHLPKWRIFAKSGHTAIEPLPIPTVLDCPNSLYDYITFSQYSLHLSLSIGPLISYTHTRTHTHSQSLSLPLFLRTMSYFVRLFVLASDEQ